jgi:hypothetical protein
MALLPVMPDDPFPELERGVGTGVFANVGQAWPDLLSTLADGLQEAYIDEFWEARPRCPSMSIR